MISKEILVFDNKKTILDKIDPQTKSQTSIELIMRSFEYFIEKPNSGRDYENRSFAKDVYNELGWFNENYDVINSFWEIFSRAMHVVNPKDYPIKPAGNVGIYKKHNDFYNCKSFPEKFNASDKTAKADVARMLQVFPQFEEFASITHSVSNFTACPDFRFNSVKGVDSEVADFLPLTVDKIQQCIDKGIDYKYTANYTEKIVDTETLEYWHRWLLNNCVKFCLEDFYFCEGERLIPNYMFSGQSLTNPTPNTVDSVQECLNNMIARLERRAVKLCELSITP